MKSSALSSWRRKNGKMIWLNGNFLFDSLTFVKGRAPATLGHIFSWPVLTRFEVSEPDPVVCFNGPRVNRGLFLFSRGNASFLLVASLFVTCVKHRWAVISQSRIWKLKIAKRGRGTGTIVSWIYDWRSTCGSLINWERTCRGPIRHGFFYWRVKQDGRWPRLAAMARDYRLLGSSCHQRIERKMSTSRTA